MFRNPDGMQDWLSWYEQLAKALVTTDPAVDFRIACLDSTYAKYRAETLRDRLVLLSQAELRANWQLAGEAFILLEHDSVSPEIIDVIVAVLRHRLAEFEPDYVFLHNRQSWLRRAFPEATFINIEVSWISRAPFPMSWQLDVAGAGKGKILAEFSDTLLSELFFDDDSEALIDDVCHTVRASLLLPAADIFLHSFRECFRRITLLPLGVFECFDGITPFFAILDEFLGRQEGDTGFILTQHPIMKIINDDQMKYLTSRYPYLVSAEGWSSQHLLPLVDQVVGDFSTVATQALFFDIEVISIGRNLSYFPIDTPLRNPLVDLLQHADKAMRRKILYWLLTRYAITEDKLFDGEWLGRFLRRARRANKEGTPWKAYENITTSKADWVPERWRSLQLLPQLEPRVYWRDGNESANSVFTEQCSVGVAIPVTGNREVARLVFPIDVGVVSRIRLDIAKGIEAIVIHDLRLEDETGNVIWRWDSNLEQFEARASVGFFRENSEESYTVFLLDNDPQFEVDLPEEILSKIKSGCALVLSLTVNSFFSQLPRVFSYISALSKTQEEVARKDRMVAPRQSSEHSFSLSGDLAEVLSLLRQALDNKGKLIAQQNLQIQQLGRGHVQLRDQLVRAEAQLELLKNLWSNLHDERF